MTNENPNRITIIAPSFSEAVIEFHRSRMGERGYIMDGPIVSRLFMLAEGVQKPKNLFEGKEMFSVSFAKKEA